MNKPELNSSMLFKMRNGDLYALLNDVDGNKIFCNKEDIEQGYSSDFVTLSDYDEELSSDGDDYDIVAIKQRNSCVKVIYDVLEGREIKEWDWVEEVEKPKENQVIHNYNYTINLTIESNTDIDKIMCQLVNQIKNFKF